MKQQILSASILNCDFSKMGEEIHAAEAAGVDWIHLDIMDGHFVPNISFGPDIVATIRKLTKLPLDTHLMISNPDDFIDGFAEAGSDVLSVHVENNANIHNTLFNIQKLDKKAGIVVNPGTPVEMIYPLLHLVEFVLLLTVDPGFGGQEFLSEVLPKINTLSNKIRELGLGVGIEVDGGIDEKTIPITREAGANIFVAGSSIFRNPLGIEAAVKKLKSV
ncbi:MAG: ribulose-phosphate 3-epimerase [Anaerolineaceae bacterium]|nr:ribulose-phosphate 3-epimerase [Anaerolineaceae bacterium]